MSNPDRNTELSEINRLIHDANVRRDQADKDLRLLRPRLWKLLDAIEVEAMASADPAGLDRLQAAVDAVSPAPAPLDMQDAAAPQQPYQMTRREFQEAERWES
jgi:hypothetical protein